MERSGNRCGVGDSNSYKVAGVAHRLTSRAVRRAIIALPATVRPIQGLFLIHDYLVVSHLTLAFH